MKPWRCRGCGCKFNGAQKEKLRTKAFVGFTGRQPACRQCGDVVLPVKDRVSTAVTQEGSV